MHMDENINLIFLELLLAIPLVGVVLWFVYRMSKSYNSNIEEIISKVVQEKNESSSKHNLEKIDLTLKPFKEQLRNLNEEIVGLMRGINIVAKKLGIASEIGNGYRALANISNDGGQEVPHLHFHLFGGENVGKMVM